MLFKFTDWKAILLCVFTAAVFWVFNSLNKQYTTNVYYPIKLTGFSRDSLFEVLPPPKYIAVNVTGQGWMLLRRSLGFGNETIEVVIPSPTATRRIVGKDLFPWAEEAIGGFKTNYVAEDTLFFSYEKKAFKTVLLGLHPDSLKFAPNYKLTSRISIEPKSLSFVGGESFIALMPDTHWLDLKLKGIDGDYDEYLKQDFPFVGVVRIDKNKINVRFKVSNYVNGQLPARIVIIDSLIEKPIKILDKDSLWVSFFMKEDEWDKMDSYDSIPVYVSGEVIDWERMTAMPCVFLSEDFEDIKMGKPVLKIAIK